MASAAQQLEPGEDTVTPGNDPEPPVERDYEAEALAHGWAPKEEFKGDPSRWVDAETFVKRADEIMPLLKAKTEKQERKIKELEREMRRFSDHYSRAQEIANERALADLKARQREAVEAGDLTAHEAIGDKIDKLREDLPTAAAPVTQKEAAQAWEDWRESNPWYDKGLKSAAASEAEIAAALFADRMTEKHMAKTSTMSPVEFFAMIEDLVVEKFPSIKAKPARVKPPSDVGAPTNGRARTGGKTWADIGDPELRRQAERLAEKWVRSGLLKSKDEYLKGYDWSKA